MKYVKLYLIAAIYPAILSFLLILAIQFFKALPELKYSLWDHFEKAGFGVLIIGFFIWIGNLTIFLNMNKAFRSSHFWSFLSFFLLPFGFLIRLNAEILDNINDPATWELLTYQLAYPVGIIYSYFLFLKIRKAERQQEVPLIAEVDTQ
jgi:hypothetical protein